MEKSASSGCGVGFGPLLTLVFVALRIAGVIEWPWIWVVSPLWLPLAIALSFVAMVFAIVGFGIAMAMLFAAIADKVGI